MGKITPREARLRRHRRLRNRITGSSERPRLCVSRSNMRIYAQLIDDVEGRTLAAAGSIEADLKGMKKGDAAAEVGKRIAERAKAAGVESVVFDRGGYKYHGRIKALADAARDAGLNF
ncbi:MAG: 50S ribosomal protein L18 [Thermoleophilia bacterium]|nr:50S ribosomal protein L18 [Thermoleophilia bacterium]